MAVKVNVIVVILLLSLLLLLVKCDVASLRLDTSAINSIRVEL